MPRSSARTWPGARPSLKQDPSDTAVNYGKPLPFSPQLEGALRAFVHQHL